MAKRNVGGLKVKDDVFNVKNHRPAGGVFNVKNRRSAVGFLTLRSAP